MLIFGIVLAVVAAGALFYAFRKGLALGLVVIAVLALLVGLIFAAIGGWGLVTSGAPTKPAADNVFGPKDCGPGTGYSPKLKKCVGNTIEFTAIKGYDVHQYSKDAGVPQGYFGPACVAGGDAAKCKANLEERVKHDPDLASAMMRDFHLLPGQVSTMTPAQVETLRQQFAVSFAKDVNLRVKTAAQIATVLDSMVDFHIEQLSGTFYTEGITPSGQIFQTQKVMDPSVNNAIVGKTPDGATLMIKDDCGFQTVSPGPIPGVVVQPPPTPPSPGTTTTTTTLPTEHGKDPTLGIIYVSGVPVTVTGCNPDGGGQVPCVGNTAGGHPVLPNPPPAGGTTGCGTDGNQPCPTPTSTTTTTAPPPPPGAPSPAPPGGGSGPSPSPAPAPSGDPGFGGSL